MNGLRIVFCIVLAGSVFFSCGKKQPDVCGTWRMAAGTYIGPDFSVTTDAENRICYKVLSGDHFAVVEVYADNPDSMFFAAVGSYEIDDSTFTETYEASNVPTKIGEHLQFQSIIQNETWDISLKKDDLQLQETWVRIKSGNVADMSR